jgi:hypothetical protein
MTPNKEPITLNRIQGTVPAPVLFLAYRILRLFPRIFLRTLVVRQSLKGSS